MDAARQLVEALGLDPAAAVASPLTTVVLLLATVALWRLLGWSRQLRHRPGKKEASGVAQGAASHGGGGGGGVGGGGGGGGSRYRGYHVGVGVGGDSPLPQQCGALAEVVRSHNEHWQREMPKTGAVSLAQAHALQWGLDDLQASERSTQARGAGGEPELPTYLWVVRTHPSTHIRTDERTRRASERPRETGHRASCDASLRPRAPAAEHWSPSPSPWATRAGRAPRTKSSPQPGSVSAGGCTPRRMRHTRLPRTRRTRRAATPSR